MLSGPAPDPQQTSTTAEASKANRSCCGGADRPFIPSDTSQCLGVLVSGAVSSVDVVASNAATRRAARAARCAATSRLSVVAVSAGVSEGAMAASLKGLNGRGRCDTLAAAAVHKKTRHRREALAWRCCPPAAVRLNAQDQELRVRDIAVGAAAWSGRLVAIAAAAWSGSLPAGARRPAGRWTVANATTDPSRKFDAASNVACPPALLTALGGDDRLTVRVQTVRNPTCPPQALAALCGNVDDLRMEIAKHQRCATSMLTALVQACDNDSEGLLAVIARHDNFKPVTLQAMIRHRSNTVREFAAGSRSCDLDMLAVLADDVDAEVRKAAARNRNCGPEALAVLADDIDWEVRRAAADNLNCDTATLLALAADSELDVVEAVLSNPRCGPAQLVAIADNGSVWARSNAARHSACNAEVLRVFAADTAAEARRETAWNPACDSETLARLVNDPAPEVRNAARHASAQRDIRGARIR